MSYLIGISATCKGRIYQLPQITEANGSKVANVILAVEKGKDADGNYLNDFVDCSFWGRDAELVVRYPEGHELLVNGKISASAYMDKTEKPRVRYKIAVYAWQSIQPLHKEELKSEGHTGSSSQKNQSKEELEKQALSFKFSKGQYGGKTVEDVLQTDCTYIYNLCKNDRVTPEMRQMLKIAYNYWYYNYYQQGKAKQLPQKADRMIKGVARNNVKSVPANTPSSKLPY